jgi:hypothetical protein
MRARARKLDFPAIFVRRADLSKRSGLVNFCRLHFDVVVCRVNFTIKLTKESFNYDAQKFNEFGVVPNTTNVQKYAMKNFFLKNFESFIKLHP